MFKKPYSFQGRIHRTEYAISILIVYFGSVIINIITSSKGGTISNGGELFFIAYIPLLWFSFAQGAKREHDLGFSGWYQLIPFRFFWLIFLKGEIAENKYGDNPKKIK